jgi:hypothetical protein
MVCGRVSDVGLKKRDRIIKRLLDRGEYREKGNSFINAEHTMAVIIPPTNGKPEDILENENVEIEISDKEMFKDIFVWNVTASAFSLEMLSDALNFLSLTDRDVILMLNNKKSDHPVEVVGIESGTRVVIAPRIETDDWDDVTTCDKLMATRVKERRNYLARKRREKKKRETGE